MEFPITTTITNTTNSDKMLRWTGKGTVWVGAKSTVTIPYEPCSVADKGQLQSLMAACRDGSIILSLNVQQEDGSCLTVSYAPAAQEKAKPVVTEPPAEPREKFVNNMAEDDKKHTIEAVGTGMAQIAERVGVTAEKVEPPVAEPVSEAHDGMVSVEGASTDGFQKDENIPEVAEGVERVMTESTVPQEMSREDVFKQLIEEKNWQGALEVLIAWFGKDKVTFTTRTIMSIKDLDKIREKYNL